MRILITEPLSAAGLSILEDAGAVVEQRKLSQEALIENVCNYDALIVRSGTQVTREVIEAGTDGGGGLRVIGRAGTGVDNIDLKAATERGVIVVNAPTANCIAAAEHTVALMTALARNIPQADAAMRRGEWDRHRFIGVALVDKTLGIIGLGRVGSEVARRARGLGMRVVAYDPYFPPERAAAMGVPLLSLREVLEQGDFITLHAPLTANTHHLINRRTIGWMRNGAFLINAARGDLVDEPALSKALEAGKLAGAALDVFSTEPPKDSPLVGHPRVITTPHLGASTVEAQEGVSIEIAQAVLAALQGDLVASAVNAPMVSPETLASLAPYVDLAERLARLAIQLGPAGPSEVRVTYSGDAAGPGDTRLLKAAVIKGLLEPISEQRINVVNAELIAQQRGLQIIEEKRPALETWPDSITIRLTDGQRREVQGAISRGRPRVVRISDFWIDLELNGCILLCQNQDRPGMIGQVGMLLGREQVNISFMQVGRDHPRGQAVMAIGLDEVPPAGLLAEIEAIPDISQALLVRM
ncbi:MAG: phosphoglycerate dehydrogenase [Ardenticatenaceae bacterium]|nr:phosphoglycerate dehydrogenase [Ardenticatenaceae bacterium]HBY95791.1 phosphoglycerate dehydrogenase [Chloroflexota bacterium]